MNMKLGIVVIDRFAALRANARTAPKRRPVGGKNHREVAAAYRGFDGAVWPGLQDGQLPVVDGIVGIESLDAVRTYVRGLPNSAEIDVIVLAPIHGSGAEQLPEWRQIGFDIGYYESQWSHFSVLLNEVVYGVNATMTAFAIELNESLLCDSEQAAARIIAARRHLAEGEADLETMGPEMRAIRIYSPSHPY